MGHEVADKKPRRRFPRSAAVLGVVVLCCGLAVTLTWWGARRALGVRHEFGWIDSDRKKLPPWEPLPVPADNAADTYDAAVGLLPTAKEPEYIANWLTAIAEGDAEEVARLLPDVRDYVGRSAAALAKVHEAATEEYVSRAEPEPSGGAPWLAGYRRLARVLAARAYLAHLDGDDRATVSAVEDGYALGVKTPRGGGLMEDVAGVAYVAIVQRPSLDTLLSGTVPPEVLRAHAGRIRRLRKDVWPISRSMHFDATLAMRRLDEMAARGVRHADFAATESGEALPPSVVEATRYRLMSAHIPKTREWVEDRLARYVEELDRPLPLSDPRFPEVVGREESDVRARNDWLAALVTPTWARSPDRWAQMVAYLEADETIACLEACRKEKGSYPKSLEELVPDYMPEVPLDPWTGKPLIYRRTPQRYTLYAVGPNRVDDGGVTEGRGLLEPDLVIVPVPPPRQRSSPPGGASAR
jgi:hypothetical protein